MGIPILQLSNGANWEEIHTEYYQANVESPSSRFMYVIPEVTIPILMENSIVITYVTSPKAKQHWKSAGYINQKVQSGILIGGTFDTEIGERKRLLLNRKTLLIFTQIVSGYSISVNFHEWIQDAYLTIWQYLPVVEDYTNNLIFELGDAVERIESKIDAL
ncbi:hypothetical protein [Nostoc sp. 2RC]|jgi:hypothetical protein|uniref:hypothetical protein n=1 Tax=Nostoc sp. 2RC TaxID=2485484 RepID=UPI001626F9A9|nr:hypothetical protein [Nostoc sp. 2RC]MBC1236187.1 hypothetical protein [Nostoc sp. 2RC]MBL1199907.1 hypothetical protein [Nostoc sp. GBBB01]